MTFYMDRSKPDNIDKIIFIIVAISLFSISISMLLWVFSSPVKKEIIKVEGGSIHLFIMSEDIEAVFIPEKQKGN